MKTSQICSLADSPKTQKSKYLEDKALFFLEIKKLFSLYIKDYNSKKWFFTILTFYFYRSFTLSHMRIEEHRYKSTRREVIVRRMWQTIANRHPKLRVNLCSQRQA